MGGSHGDSIPVGVWLPLLAAAAVAVPPVAVEATRRVRAGGGGLRLAGIIGLAGLLAVAFQLRSLSPVALATALVLLVALSLAPALALDASPASRARLVGAALLSTSLLFLAESLERSYGLSRTMALQAIDQVGEMGRLTAFRPDVTGREAPQRVLWQTLLVFPFFVITLPMLTSAVMLWYLGLISTLMAGWQVAAGWVVASARSLRSLPPELATVIVLGLGLHPFLLDKLSWDFVPPGTLLFILAYVAERRGRRGLLTAALGLAALCHPMQATMAALWALDHARRSWTPNRTERLRVLLVPGVVCAQALLPFLVLAAGLLLPTEERLITRVAAYSRQFVAEGVAAGSFSWAAVMAGTNAAKLALFLLPLGFLPVLRWNRFLGYAAFELAYSLATPNGFVHGSSAGFLGLLGCAALENARQVPAPKRRAVAAVALGSLLPLQLAWNGQHAMVALLRNDPVDRITPLAELMRPGDEQRTCVGQSTTYVFLAGRCRRDAPLRFPDDVASTVARTADVYLLDLERLHEEFRWPPGIQEALRRVVYRHLHAEGEGKRSFGFQDDISTEDLLLLLEEVRTGALHVTAMNGPALRLDRVGVPEGVAGQGEAAARVLASLDTVLEQRRAK